MNAALTKLPAHDDVIPDFLWGDNETAGDLLVEYNEDSYTSGDERFVTHCEATIVGLHIGGNFVIDRDGMAQIASMAHVESEEEEIAEKRVS